MLDAHTRILLLCVAESQCVQWSAFLDSLDRRRYMLVTGPVRAIPSHVQTRIQRRTSLRLSASVTIILHALQPCDFAKSVWHDAFLTHGFVCFSAASILLPIYHHDVRGPCLSWLCWLHNVLRFPPALPAPWSWQKRPLRFVCRGATSGCRRAIHSKARPGPGDARPLPCLRAWLAAGPCCPFAPRACAVEGCAAGLPC